MTACQSFLMSGNQGSCASKLVKLQRFATELCCFYSNGIADQGKYAMKSRRLCVTSSRHCPYHGLIILGWWPSLTRLITYMPYSLHTTVQATCSHNFSHSFPYVLIEYPWNHYQSTMGHGTTVRRRQAMPSCYIPRGVHLLQVVDVRQKHFLHLGAPGKSLDHFLSRFCLCRS